MPHPFRILSLIAIMLLPLALPAAASAQSQMHLPVTRIGARQAVRQMVLDQVYAAHDFTITCKRVTARRFRCNARWIQLGSDGEHRANARVTLHLQADAARNVEARTLTVHYRSWCEVLGSMQCFKVATTNIPETWSAARSAYVRSG